MSGATYIRNYIIVNVMTEPAFFCSDFIVLNGNMKIHIPRLETFVYPDAVVVFERPSFYEDRTDMILNPLLIVEMHRAQRETATALPNSNIIKRFLRLKDTC